MKKYLVLLIIPLLFFSMGCDDDEGNDTIPVSEYPESILGNWKMESIEYNTITHNIEIDPVYGTETISTTQIDSTSISPFNSTVIPPTTEFRVVTFEYDGDSHYNIIFLDSSGNTNDGYDCILVSNFYNINQDYITYTDMNGNLSSDQIEYLSNIDLQLKSESSDTSEIINNSYVITRNIRQHNYTRYNSELNLISCFDYFGW